MKNFMDLAGKTILIAGGSSGIGRQTAITLSEFNAKVILLARREDQLKETLDLLKGQGHAYYSFDLTDLEGVENLIQSIVQNHGVMKGMVFGIGIMNMRPYKTMTPQIMQNMMTTNFFSFYELVRQFAKKKNSSDGAKIVAISSTASLRPRKGQAAYAASKAAMDAAVLSLAQELMPRKININCVRPGYVDTIAMQEYMMNDESQVQPYGKINPESVATLIAYLLSDAANMITGRGIEIDGGFCCNVG